MIADRWGVSDDEVARPYPCDDHVPTPGWQAWRGVSVAAPPQRLWPWLIQLRLAPYSYDRIDNLGRRSPRELLHLDDPKPGDPFSASAGRPLGQVLAVEHGVHLTGRMLSATITYQLVPAPGGTRLLMKIAGNNRWAGPLICLGDLVMARRQLLNLAHLAESDPTRSTPDEPN